jgi:hypothetical protein
MFKTENNVPPVYVEESRDFQLFCKLLDLVVNSVRYESTSINHMSVDCIDDKLLTLLLSRYGIKVTYEHNDYFRTLVGCINEVVRYKGSRYSIDCLINAFLRIYNLSGGYKVDINKQEGIINIHLATRTLSNDIVNNLLTTIQQFTNTAMLVNIDYVISTPIDFKVGVDNKVDINPIESKYYSANPHNYYSNDDEHKDYKVLLQTYNNAIFGPNIEQLTPVEEEN